MKALVYRGNKTLTVSEIEQKDISETEVVIKVAYCGVCGTDLHIYSGEGGAFDVSPPLVMGHEFSGFVEKVGSRVSKVEIGDLVSVNPNQMCGECYFCKNGMEQFCKESIGIGTTVDGGFAQSCVVEERQIAKFSDGVEPMIVAMSEPVSCCIHGIDLCHIKLGDEVLIIGGGPIGLVMMQLAKMAGAAKVIVSEPIESKRAMALKLGADEVLDPFNENIDEWLRANTKNIRVVIECVGNVHTIKNAIDWAGYGATVMLFGLTGPDTAVDVSPDLIFKKEIKLVSSFINPYTFERAVAMLESGRLNVLDIITDCIALEDSVAVFENDDYRKKGKIMIQMNT